MMILTIGRTLEDIMAHKEVVVEVFKGQVTFKEIEFIQMGVADIEMNHRSIKEMWDFNDLSTVQDSAGVDKALIEIDQTLTHLSFVTQTLGGVAGTSDTSNNKDHLAYDIGWTPNQIIDQMNVL